VNAGDVYMGDILNDDIHEHEGKKKEGLDPVTPLSTRGRYHLCRGRSIVAAAARASHKLQVVEVARKHNKVK
jgi:hypothetical protein